MFRPFAYLAPFLAIAGGVTLFLNLIGLADLNVGFLVVYGLAAIGYACVWWYGYRWAGLPGFPAAGVAIWAFITLCQTARYVLMLDMSGY